MFGMLTVFQLFKTYSKPNLIIVCLDFGPHRAIWSNELEKYPERREVHHRAFTHEAGDAPR